MQAATPKFRESTRCQHLGIRNGVFSLYSSYSCPKRIRNSFSSIILLDQVPAGRIGKDIINPVVLILPIKIITPQWLVQNILEHILVRCRDGAFRQHD
jgi:hypothetical protein